MTEPIRPLAEAVRDALARSPLAEGLREQEVLGRWAEIVGPQNARHSQALCIRDGVLWVLVEGSVWAQELSLLKPGIQDALNASLGGKRIREIRFRSGPLVQGSADRSRQEIRTPGTG